MGYAYEDDDVKKNTTENVDEVDENLREVKKDSPNEATIEDVTPKIPAVDTPAENPTPVKSETSQNVVNQLLKQESNQPQMQVQNSQEEDDYNIDNLLDSDDLYLDDLLNKKDKKFFGLYLGPNYKKIIGDKYNWAAFFFGGSYLMYRKVYVIGAIFQAISLGALIFLPVADVKVYIILILEFILAVLAGFFANQIILNDVASKIINLKIQREKNIREKIKKAGGVNIIAFLISISITAFIYYVELSNLINEIIKLFVK